MKGALAAYVEAVRSLIEDGVSLKGDVIVAAVAGEIEKTQQGDAQGAEYRGYATGSRYLVGHGGAADVCILGEPTENKLVLAHFGTLWVRLRVRGPFVHTAFSMGRIEENSIVRMRSVLDRVVDWLPEWEEEMSYGDVRGVANVGAIQGGFGWRASRTPHATDLFIDLRVPPDVPMAEARRRALALRFAGRGRGDVYVTAGAETDGRPGSVPSPRRTRRSSAHAERDGTLVSDASVLNVRNAPQNGTSSAYRCGMGRTSRRGAPEEGDVSPRRTEGMRMRLYLRRRPGGADDGEESVGSSP